MQITETLNEGLKREFRVVVPAAELSGKLQSKLEEMKARANIPGFRPGKVPVAHLKRLYGKSAMAEIVNDAVQESTRSVATERELKLANEPKIVFPEDQAEIEGVIEGRTDLAYTVALEVLPKIEVKDFKGLKLTRETTPVTDEDVSGALGRIAEQNRPFVPRPEGEAAEAGDKVTIDYRGTVDGEAFQGGAAENADLVLGSGLFIPGFEDQLVGAKAGEAREVSITFPEPYPAAHLAGKAAVFAVTVKAIAKPGEVKVDDEFAKGLGMESLAKLEAAIRDQIGREDQARSRQRVKRKLLDALDSEYRFDLPQTLVDQEFEIIWRNVGAEMERAGRTWADESTTEEAAREEYRAIAERRVRLGLLLAEIGDKNGITVADEEVQRALFDRARQYPGQERKVLEFYQKNPGALAELRAPIFEDKVVDFMLELASVTETPVSREALYRDEDEEAEAAPAAAAEPEAKPKKSRAKKPAAEAE
jgi:trigger factor